MIEMTKDTLDVIERRESRFRRRAASTSLLLGGVLLGTTATMGVQYSTSAIAKSPFPQPAACERNSYPAQVTRVIDGDTVEAMLDLGEGVFKKTDIRLAGVDTPEVYGPTVNRDMVRGPAATEFTKQWLAARENLVEIVSHGDDKYGGRIDATIYPRGGGQSLSDALKQAGHEK